MAKEALALHVLDGAEPLVSGSIAALEALARALAATEEVVVVQADASGKLAFYRQREWLPAGYAKPLSRDRQ